MERDSKLALQKDPELGVAYAKQLKCSCWAARLTAVATLLQKIVRQRSILSLAFSFTLVFYMSDYEYDDGEVTSPDMIFVG